MAGRAKCETPSTLLEACSLTWTECWKCIWLPQMPATPMVVSFSTSLPTLKIPTLCWLGCGHHHFCCWQGTQVVGNGCTRPSSSIHRLRMGQPSASPTAPFTHLQKEQQESLLVGRHQPCVWETYSAEDSSGHSLTFPTQIFWKVPWPNFQETTWFMLVKAVINLNIKGWKHFPN